MLQEIATCVLCGDLFTFNPRRHRGKFCTWQHYQAWQQGNWREHFWSQIVCDLKTQCWLWAGDKSRGGYGRFRRRDVPRAYAHCVAYEMLVGPIPKGYEVDHGCRRPACVNPSHLEAVTVAENRRRAQVNGFNDLVAGIISILIGGRLGDSE